MNTFSTLSGLGTHYVLICEFDLQRIISVHCDTYMNKCYNYIYDHDTPGQGVKVCESIRFNYVIRIQIKCDKNAESALCVCVYLARWQYT